MDLQFRRAVPAHIPSLAKLVNSAYRGDASRQGWTHEADLIDGDSRTDEMELSRLMANLTAVFLLCLENDVLMGSVYLEKQGNDLYLGMLSVNPASQAKGIGKALLAQAGRYAIQQGCNAIIMTVISVRHELIDWYNRYGYQPTGETEPFPKDQHFGMPKQPLHFVVLRKELTPDLRD